MHRTRRLLVYAWAVLMASVSIPTAGASDPHGGLFAPTACLSPAVLITLALTPTDTLVDILKQVVFPGYNPDKNNE